MKNVEKIFEKNIDHVYKNIEKVLENYWKSI